MKSPISWYGGKNQLTHWLLKFVPPADSYTTYVEVFGGSAALLHALPPGHVRVYNDLDERLHNFWRVLQDEELFARFARKAAFVPHSRLVYEQARDTYDQETDPVMQALKFFIIARQSFSGDRQGGWSYSRTEISSGMSRSTAKWLSAVDRLYEVFEHWRGVQIEQLDFRELIPKYDDPKTFFYLDPPYVLETRSQTGRYQHEMTLADHNDLVDLLLGVKGMCLLSSYNHPIYSRLEAAGWRREERHTQANAAGRTRLTGLIGEGSTQKVRRVECVWINPQAQAHLTRRAKDREEQMTLDFSITAEWEEI